MVRIMSKTRPRSWVDRLGHLLPRRIRGISPQLPRDSRCRPVAFDHHDDFQEHRTQNASEYLQRQRMLVEMGRGVRPILTEGFCICCNAQRTFSTDPAAQGIQPSAMPNWREGLICSGCGLNGRMRASIHLMLWSLPGRERPRIYATEQVTALFRWIHLRYPHSVGSEYLRDGTPRGGTNPAGIRHEDLTALSFPDESIDSIVSLEVMEHVPDFRAAFSECARVLVSGGELLLCVPFHRGPHHLERARVRDDGSIEHLLPPEYHGDPLDPRGCLCFHHFGWDMLDFLRDAGFRRVTAYSIWSRDLCYLAAEGDLLQFVAVK
jgi:SAM-dependent methyltransferase